MAGMDASTITSLGTWRLVMPLSLSTIARAGPAAMAAAISASIAARSASGRVWMRLSRSPMPSLADTPSALKVAACLVNTSPKYARTAWPKMIGSETFIMVALRCTENSTPFAFASAICSARKACSATALMTVASTISPASTGSDSLSTVTSPVSATSSMRSSSGESSVIDCSLDRKSPLVMCATCVFESGDHAPIEWGWLWA